MGLDLFLRFRRVRFTRAVRELLVRTVWAPPRLSRAFCRPLGSPPEGGVAAGDERLRDATLGSTRVVGAAVVTAGRFMRLVPHLFGTSEAPVQVRVVDLHVVT